MKFLNWVMVFGDSLIMTFRFINSVTFCLFVALNLVIVEGWLVGRSVCAFFCGMCDFILFKVLPHGNGFCTGCGIEGCLRFIDDDFLGIELRGILSGFVGIRGTDCCFHLHFCLVDNQKDDR